MEYPTFRKWLAEHGCRFDTQPERRGAGHGTLVIHRAMTMFLPLEISQDRERRPAVPPPGRQKRTSDERPLMSALPPIADIAAGRTAELPLVGESHNLDPRSVRQVCEALGLDWSKLPGLEGRV
jgi:hypothetical protein